MKTPRALLRVIEGFERLPGIGPKTASRLGYYLLNVPEEKLEVFGNSLIRLKKDVVKCGVCTNVGDSDPCEVCADLRRDQSVICVVEQPLDVVAIENSGKFNGVYHVLHGVIDPLNYVGPEDLSIDKLLERLGGVEEIILGLNPTMEGEATGMYLQDKIKETVGNIVVSKLAQGLPLGGDVEYADSVTLGRALEGRRSI